MQEHKWYKKYARKKMPKVLFLSLLDGCVKNRDYFNIKLMDAAKGWNGTTITNLLEKGADVNARDSDGKTPLIFAAWYNHPESCALLIENGADVNAADIHGQTALMYAAKEVHTDICALLIERGADVNAIDGSGMTALKWAELRDQKETAAFLKVMEHLNGFMAKEDFHSFIALFGKCIGGV